MSKDGTQMPTADELARLYQQLQAIQSNATGSATFSPDQSALIAAAQYAEQHFHASALASPQPSTSASADMDTSGGRQASTVGQVDPWQVFLNSNPSPNKRAHKEVASTPPGQS
eukprot:6904370-Karenia_brevis.AAC.1